MEKQKLRSEIEDNYKWDLSLIYKDEEEFYKNLKEAEDHLEDILNYKGKIVTSSDNLYKFIKFELNFQRKLYKLHYYTHLLSDEDTTNTNSQKLSGLVKNLFVKQSELSSFVNSEMMSVDYETILEFIKENKNLEKYKFMLENIYRFKNHTLSEEIEKVLSITSKVMSSPEDIYSSLTDSDITFGNILVEGKEIELTESNYSTFLKHKDRQVRKDAFTKVLTTYGSFKNTISNTFTSFIDSLIANAKLKNYNSTLEASLYSDNINTSVYNNLIKTINDNLDVAYNYFNMKKEILSLDEMHLYDIYVDLVPSFSKNYTFEEAKELVLEALLPLGNDYQEKLKEAFNSRWIDIYNSKGKKTGAYSSGFYDTKPYILLNYEGKINDVSTLAHELGHSMHTYYSCENNEYHDSSYEIFVAEVASTVNELLLNFYMLDKAELSDEKKYILNTMMELFKSTIYRQTMFAEFERDCHQKQEFGEILTYENISNDYKKLVTKYFGDSVYIDDEIKYEWERIPHFYYDFYVYKYAVGLSCACYIVNGILNKKENALENYLRFLKAGGSKYPKEILKDAGIDIEKEDYIKDALTMFNDIIEQYKKLI